MKADLKQVLMDAVSTALDHHKDKILFICSEGPPIHVDVKVEGLGGTSFVRVEIDSIDDEPQNGKINAH